MPRKPSCHDSKKMIPRRGFSLVELCIAIVLAALLVTMLIWRVTKSRESSRRIECESRFRTIFVALQSYHLQHGPFPIGTQNVDAPIRSEPKGYHHNWIEGLLPQLQQQELYDQIDFDFGVYAEPNRAISKSPPNDWICPAAVQFVPAQSTSYVGICSSTETPIDPESNGTFIQNRPIAPRDLIDGSAYVVVVGEKVVPNSSVLPWNSGTRASLRTLGHPINEKIGRSETVKSAQSKTDTGTANETFEDELYVGGVSSNHAGGAYLLTAAGEIRFYSEQMDQILLQQLGGRNDSDQPQRAEDGTESEISDEIPQL